MDTDMAILSSRHQVLIGDVHGGDGILVDVQALDGRLHALWQRNGQVGQRAVREQNHLAIRCRNHGMTMQ